MAIALVRIFLLLLAFAFASVFGQYVEEEKMTGKNNKTQLIISAFLAFSLGGIALFLR